MVIFKTFIAQGRENVAQFRVVLDADLLRAMGGGRSAIVVIRHLRSFICEQLVEKSGDKEGV